MLMVNVPASVGLFVLATPIVQLLLERGHFLRADTIATAAAVQCYAIGLVGYSAARIASPVFYALQRSRVAVLLSTISIAVNLALSLVFVRWIGFRGLALATSIAAMVHGVLSLVLLRRRLGRIGGRHLAITFLKIAAASAVMAVVVLVATHELSQWVGGAGAGTQAFRLFGAIGFGLVAVAGSAKLLRISEFDTLLDHIRHSLAARTVR